MAYIKILLEDLEVLANVSGFKRDGFAGEYHVILKSKSYENLEKAESVLMNTNFYGLNISAKRVYCENPSIAPFAIGQKPLGEYPFAEWLYIKDCPDIHNGYQHIWDIAICSQTGGPGRQTTAVLENYESRLADKEACIADNCIRTWFYINNIDSNYQEMVEARKSFFDKIGLTNKTHYIASTGICGEPTVPSACIQMDGYAIKGLIKGQIQYLKAKTHLNPTYEYGVTFERGTKITYGDRSHVFISGTASINNKGEVLHVGDIGLQTQRMWENVGKLLEEAGCTTSDLMQIIVYIRNESDYEQVAEMFEEEFSKVPYVITLAPVCRPTWLIEMECIAIKAEKKPRFRDF